MLSISGLLLKLKQEPTTKLSCQKQSGSESKNGQKQVTTRGVTELRQPRGH